jgi:hypothetical protein
VIIEYAFCWNGDSNDGYWIARGEGHMRPIICEGNTRSEARKLFEQEFARQYAEMETHTHFALEERQ